MAQHAVHGRIPAGRVATWLPSIFGLALIPLLPYVDEPCEHLVRSSPPCSNGRARDAAPAPHSHASARTPCRFCSSARACRGAPHTTPLLQIDMAFEKAWPPVEADSDDKEKKH